MNKVETREDNFEESVRPLRSSISRRSFLGKSIAVGAGTMGAGFLAKTLAAQVSDPNSKGGLTRGRRGYSPVPGGSRNHRSRFVAAIQRTRRHPRPTKSRVGPGIRPTPRRLRCSTTTCRSTSTTTPTMRSPIVAFLNAYLASKGAEPVNLDQFRTLPSSHGNRRPANRTTHQSDAAYRRHELVHALPQR